MNSIIKFGILLFLSILVSCSNEQPKTDPLVASQNDTIKKDSPKSFEIDFPVTRFQVEKIISKDSSVGNTTITNWILRGAENNNPFIYFVSQNKIPQQLKAEVEKDSNSIYKAFQSGLTRSGTPLGGTNFTFKKIEYKSYKGLESSCNVFNGEGIIKSRMYNINDTLYMISAGGKNINVEQIDKFLNSFKVKN
jgi:hypothetical protein